MATEAPLIMSQSYPHRPGSLLIPSNPAYNPGSPRGGILINAARVTSPLTPSSSSSGLWAGLYTPRSPSPLSASLSPNTNTNTTAVDRRNSVNSSLGSRKIRFAPLPEPRRDVLVAEDGTELPCSAPADATAFPLQSPGAGPSITLDRTDSLMTDSGASTASTETDSQSQTARKRTKRNSLLKLFGMKSSSSLPKRTSTSSLPTTDSTGTIGGIPVPGLGLFRASSRESWSGEPLGYASDNSLSRRMSLPLRSDSAARRPATQPNYGTYGAPMMQTASEGSGAQRPQRMLNGRVYGARRAKERIQPQPSMEPEFSEWGYGGMGSVGTAGEYGKLQSNASSVGGGGDDDDDGSGMTWLRKRKEKREREEQEKKAAEEAAAAEAAKAAEESADANTESRASTETAQSTPTIHAEPPTEPKTPTREAHSPPGSPTTSQPPTHTNPTPLSPQRTQIIRTVSATPSRQGSAATVTAERHNQSVIAVPAHSHRGRQDSSVLGSGVAMSPETSPERSSSGSSRRSSSSDDEEGSSSTTGRDEEDDEEEENQKRKTALSAGIEKISRHHA